MSRGLRWRVSLDLLRRRGEQTVEECAAHYCCACHDFGGRDGTQWQKCTLRIIFGKEVLSIN